MLRAALSMTRWWQVITAIREGKSKLADFRGRFIATPTITEKYRRAQVNRLERFYPSEVEPMKLR